MELGHIVDYCIEWNELNEPEDEKGKKNKNKASRNKRKATQADWDALLG